MKIPYSWPAEMVEEIPSPTELAEQLTMRGFEVEEMIAPGAAIQNVVVGKILEQSPHPDANKLTLCRVTDGAQTLDIVCGASNMKAGDSVALARIGVVLPGNFVIEKRKIRGQVSEGMLCSTRELGLGDEHSGILILPSQYRLGARLIDEMGLNDTIYEINVTPNRPDVLCAVGIAREIAAACGTTVRMPDTSPIPPGTALESVPSITLLDEDLCPRYTGLIIQGIRIAASPKWLRRRLEACGVRSVNNVVDATNLALMELGQPLHAFDLNQLEEKRIVVRRAKAGERIVTIDGEDRELKPSMLVIADANRPVAVAGVMGGLQSEVGNDTDSLLLESAYFDPPSIRRTSKQLGMSSEASYRFERGVDFETVIPASWRCARLIQQLAGGVVVGGIGVADTKQTERIHSLQGRSLTLRYSYCNRLLGKTVPPEAIERIFVSLCIPVKEKNGETITLQVPSFRNDLRREADLVEEVARCHGYNEFSPTLPSTPVKAPEPQAIERQWIQRLRQYLTDAGFDEAITYSFTDPEWVKPFTPENVSFLHPTAVLQNPLNSRESLMRTSLVPSLLTTARRNIAHGNMDFGLFEIARKFLPTGEEMEEQFVLTAVVVGNPNSGWRNSKPEMDFYDAKGLAEGIARIGALRRYRLTDGPSWLHPKRRASIQAGKQIVGCFGELHPDLSDQYELPGRVLVLEFDLRPLSDAFRGFAVQFRPFSIFPAIKRDLALSAPERVTARQVEEILRQEGGALLEDLLVFDYYRGKQVKEGYVGLGLRMTFRSLEETLKEETVGSICEKIISRLQKELDVQLRT